MFMSAMAVSLLAAAELNNTSSLSYGHASWSPVPIPPAEQGLQTVVAEPWFSVSGETPGLEELDNALILEGPIFDSKGNLVFVEVAGGRIMRLSPDHKLDILLPKNEFGSAGLALHSDGRLFVAGIGGRGAGGGGAVFAIRADGSEKEIIISPQDGYIPNDLVFDAAGGFYFTDFQGNHNNPTGGVYYVSPDMKTVTPVLTGLASPNGITLSPNGEILWVGESATGFLHRVELSGPAEIGYFGATISYRFFGAGVDAMRVDADGNVYAALFGSGRVVVLNSKGIPIAQILIPGRDAGEFLNTTSMAIKPGTDELYILSSDGDGQRGKIFRAGAFAKAVPEFVVHK